MIKNLNTINHYIDVLLAEYSTSNRLTLERIDTRYKQYAEYISELFNKEDSKGALKILNYVIMELPMCTDFLYFRALCYLNEDEINEAEKQLREYIKVSNNESLKEKAKNLLDEL